MRGCAAVRSRHWEAARCGCLPGRPNGGGVLGEEGASRPSRWSGGTAIADGGAAKEIRDFGFIKPLYICYLQSL